MATKIRIPAPLRKLTKDQAVVDGAGATIEEVLADLEKNYPGIKERICDETGQVRRFINIFLNGEDIRFKDGIKTKLPGEAEVSIIPAIAGGSPTTTRKPHFLAESSVGGLGGPVGGRA